MPRAGSRPWPQTEDSLARVAHTSTAKPRNFATTRVSLRNRGETPPGHPQDPPGHPRTPPTPLGDPSGTLPPCPSGPLAPLPGPPKMAKKPPFLTPPKKGPFLTPRAGKAASTFCGDPSPIIWSKIWSFETPPVHNQALLRGGKRVKNRGFLTPPRGGPLRGLPGGGGVTPQGGP